MSDADKVTMTTDDMGDETVGPKVATPEEIAVWRKNLLGLMTTQQMISVFRYIDTLKAEVTRLRGHSGTIADSLRELRLDPRNQASIDIIIAKLDRESKGGV